MRDIREAPLALDNDVTVRTRLVVSGTEAPEGGAMELREGDTARVGVVYELEVIVANMAARVKEQLALVLQVRVARFLGGVSRWL